MRGTSVEAGAGNDTIIVLGETSSGTPSGNGQIGNDGTIDGGPGNDTIFVRGGGDNGYVTDRGGIKRGDGGTGGIGNDGSNSEIYLLGSPDNRAVISGGPGGNGSAAGEGGNGGHGTDGVT
ncbi:hypothetical protein ACWC98_11985 [Streptomyces goshikiensis]